MPGLSSELHMHACRAKTELQKLVDTINADIEAMYTKKESEVNKESHYSRKDKLG